MAREYSTAGGLRAKARTVHAKIQVFDAETEPGASSKIIGLNFSCRNLSPRHSVTLIERPPRGEFVEGSEERSGRAASHRSCAAGPRSFCRALRNQFRARVRLCSKTRREPD